jgi:hypothetical protein
VGEKRLVFLMIIIAGRDLHDKVNGEVIVRTIADSASANSEGLKMLMIIERQRMMKIQLDLE